MLQQFCLQHRSVFVRYDLVVVALDRESWYRDRFQILRLVCLRESLNAFVMSERAAHHALTPPIPDNSLRYFRSAPVKAIKRTRGQIEIKLRAILSKRLAE